MTKEEKYKAYSFRLNEKTIKRLKELKKRGKSWNLIFKELVDKYEGEERNA